MTFLQKYELLKKSIPVPAVGGLYNENCEVVDYIYYSKNCYFCFDSFKLEDSMYCISCWGKNLVDCDYVIECELCYECVNSNSCYSSTYLFDCNNSRDCHFCSLCVSCSDCFGCVGLTHKQYCIFNKQYSKEEYFKKIKELRRESPQKTLDQMLELKKKIPHPANQQYNNENCPYGDYINNSKNSYWCFNGYWLEDCGFIFNGGILKKCWDGFDVGPDKGKGAMELCYESVETIIAYNCVYIFGCDNCTNCYYASYLRNCSDCFGCVGLTNKKYCILNNQLTKEQYEKAIGGIRKELGWKV